jgi:RNA polymerase sigma-70 factor (ECF subfamily)
MATAITTLPCPELPSTRREGGPADRGGESAQDRAARIDTALMALYRDTGSREAFEALYRHARGPVLEWIQALLRRGSRRLDPADLVQDTFVNVYRYRASFRDEHPKSFRSWVRAIAANTLRRALESSSRVPLELQEGPGELVDRRRPEGAAEQREELERLGRAWALFLAHYARAFDRLSPRDRRALHLVEVDGLSYAAAGAALAVSPSNMKMIMLRARCRLRRHMQAAMAPGEAA